MKPELASRNPVLAMAHSKMDDSGSQKVAIMVATPTSSLVARSHCGRFFLNSI
jgi:hypothetical protein